MIFVGDLVERGPDTPGVLRRVVGTVGAGDVLCVAGNHEAKLVRALSGRNVTISHGLAETLAQLADEPKEFPGGGAPLRRRAVQPLRPGRRAACGSARRTDRAITGPGLPPACESSRVQRGA